MRNWQHEFEQRVGFLQEQLRVSGARGFIFGNSGGKDSALVGILCKAAHPDTAGVLLPCASKRNYGEDTAHANALADAFGITSLTVDLTDVRQTLLDALPDGIADSPGALNNIAPRLRMTALYALANSQNRLVVGTGNRSERHMGYFTKWGDGAHDVNPMADLLATEVTAFLTFLGAPAAIIAKAPSAGLFDGQTDEADMGVSYAVIDAYLQGETVPSEAQAIIERYHRTALHKLNPIPSPRSP